MTVTESWLREIWSEVLEIPAESIGEDENFFLLGGDSITAGQIVNRVSGEYEGANDVAQLFDMPTIRTYGQFLDSMQRNESGIHVVAGSGGASGILRAPRSPPMLASAAQQRMWILYQYEGRYSLAYHSPVAVRLRGPLNLGALERAFNILIARHEILRTQYAMDPQTYEITVHVRADAKITLPVIRATEAQIPQLQHDFARAIFDLEKDLPVRAQVMALGPDHHVLMLTYHDAVFERWSIHVFGKELSALYDAYVSGAADPLSPLPIQYYDYVCWQRQLLQAGETRPRQIRYWKTALADVPASLKLPFDHLRPSMASYRAAIAHYLLPDTFSAELTGFAADRRLTPFIVLMAGLSLLLWQCSRQNDVVIGTLVSNRNLPALETLIGFFLNTLVIRSRVQEDQSVGAFLEEMKERIFDAFAHQDVDFSEVVQTIRPQRNAGNSPLFQVMFAMQNAPLDQLAFTGLEVTRLAHDREGTMCDLTVRATPLAEGLLLSFEYATDLFEAPTIEKLIRRYAGLLRVMLDDPARSLGHLPDMQDRSGQLLNVQPGYQSPDSAFARSE